MTSSFYLSPTVTGSRAATPVHNATLSQMSIPTARRGAGGINAPQNVCGITSMFPQICGPQPRDIWKCLEICLIVTAEGGGVLVNILQHTGQSPPQRTTRPQTSLVLRTSTR